MPDANTKEPTLPGLRSRQRERAAALMVRIRIGTLSAWSAYGESDMPKRRPPVWHDVTCEMAGVLHRGRYEVSDKMIRVQASGGGEKSTQLGGSPAETLTRMMLSELVRERRD